MAELVPPYPLIADCLRDGRVIPFLGAGASLGSRAPAPATGGSPEQGEGDLPSSRDLALRLARKARFPEGEGQDLATVAQYYNVVGGRMELHRELHEIFDRDFGLSAHHRYLASLPRPLLIVTTNYDDLIERALDQAGRAYDVVVHTTDPALGDRVLWWPHSAGRPEPVNANKLFIDLDTTAVVYKMHGAVDRREPQRDQFVITEDDYVDFLTRIGKKKAIPAIFAEPFQSRHFLFLGYGLRDWNLRVVLNRIEKDLRRPRHITSWAIDAKPSALETRFWQSRNVEVYPLAIEEFLTQLEAVP
jgi:hypothetical protein